MDATLSRAAALTLSMLCTFCAHAAAAPSARPQAPKISLVVLDKNCQQIVQPYRIEDNVVELLSGVAKRGFDWVRNRVEKVVTGAPEAATAHTDHDQFTTETRNEAKRLNWLPMSTEVEYGRRTHETMLNGTVDPESDFGKPLYATATQLLAEILESVNGKHDYEFKVFVLNEATTNAIARPGGYLYLDKGLLVDPKQALKARFALAHEIAHVLRRHETKELQSLVVDSFTARDAMAKALKNSKKDPGALIKNVAVGKNIYVRHQIDQELQADSCAARLLLAAYPEPEALVSTLAAFVKELPPYDKPTATPVSATPASTAKSGAAASKGESIVQGVSALTEIVDTPASRHPNTLERTQNLDAITHELLAPGTQKAMTKL